MTPAEALAGDPTFDGWDETKRQWFCGRVVDIQSAIERMKGPDYSTPLAKLKSSLRKTIAAPEPFGIEVIDYLAEGDNGDMTGALMELMAFKKTAKRLLAMPKPDHLIELMTKDGPDCGYSGGDGPGGRRKWRNGVVTEMVYDLIEEAGVVISRTGKSASRTEKSTNSEGSPSMKLMARVLDCLDPRKRPRKTDTVLKRVVRTKGKKAPKK